MKFRPQIHITPRLLFALLLTVLAIPNVALAFTENMSVPGKLANILVPVPALWLAMTLCRRPGKTVWTLFPLIFFAAFQIVLLYLFGRSVIAVDMFLNLVTTNPGEALELLDNLVPAVATVIILYVPVLILGICSIRRKEKLERTFLHRQRKIAAGFLLTGLLSLSAAYVSDEDYRIENDMYPVNVCYNLFLAVERADATAKYSETSAGFTFKARPTHAADSTEIYVLVIGETARAMNFGIYGYDRNTTPMLAKTNGLTVFTDVLTQSNTTHKSVPMLLSAASAEDYDCIYREKGIITAFREAGFHTAFFSNQRPNHSFIDIFGMEADEWRFIKAGAEADSNTSDDKLAGFLAEETAKGHRKLFVVLHAYGSHFNYRERYPRSAAVFRPDEATEAKASNRPELINAYDNTIRQTDRLLADIIAMLAKSGAAAAMLYTSDHGENIFDDSRGLFLHASPIPSYYDMHVPFLIWTSPAYRRSFPETEENLHGNSRKSVASNAAVFHTMLSMAGIATPYRNDSLSVASGRYTEMTRHYLNDHNKPVALDKIGLDKEDIDMLRHSGMRYP
ncbi:MAG: lipid A phosphoethanolamine transferase [Bacteroidales bacterium]|nr:lipid A phosphoethanolamine transferase [Bacteroidales bacterium]MCM1146621.1 lipid A phosphoethanolamine transferase [Bacteroidales bacterium]MCM1206013.1 lipid A phosphoethanolamine transferase [Bacillota bacterium]MCM1511493.1 lipid A phosphoethanolamine transferase [Clostridium sp.]